MKIAILTRSDFRSPRILSDSLKFHLEQKGTEVEIIYEIGLLNRMVSIKDSKLSFYFWLKIKLKHFLSDARLLKKIKQFDAVIISECIPNGFLRKLYNVEKFKKIIKKPVCIYEVYFLGNAPTQINFLKKNDDPFLKRYDFHLSVANVTEIKLPVSENWYPIGIKAESWNLKPLPKKEMIAIIDFVQPGYEAYRDVQIRVLNKTGIKYISLEGGYTIEEIRNIYQSGAIFFMQFPEAFGLPVLECLCAGCQIFTPESWWPMSWRLNENPKIHGEGILPDCFTVYDNSELEEKLMKFKAEYDLVKTPQKVFDNFLANYPEFYYGNDKELQRVLTHLKDKIETNG